MVKEINMIRTTLSVALFAGLPVAVSAQEAFVVNYSMQEVFAGTLNPVPFQDNDIGPGEAARIRVGVQARINGSSAIGQTVTYVQPSPGGIGTVRGLGSAVYDLIGNGFSASGTWGGFPGSLAGPVNGAPFNSGLTPGTVQPGGVAIHGMGGAQFILPGQSANSTNSDVQIFRGVWQPASLQFRVVQFVARASIQVPSGEHNSVLLAYGLGTDPSSGENYDLLVGKYFPTVFGSGAIFTVGIPSPSTLGVIAAGAVLFTRRRTL
jgi:hypothetical protein